MMAGFFHFFILFVAAMLSFVCNSSYLCCRNKKDLKCISNGSMTHHHQKKHVVPRS